MNTVLNKIFYINLVLSFIVYLLPPEYKIAVYTPSILGWFWLLGLLPITVITFIWSGINDYKNQNLKKLKTRFIVFISVIIISVGYWFYAAFKYGNV